MLKLQDYFTSKEIFILDISLELGLLAIMLIIFVTAIRDPFLKSSKDRIAFVHLPGIEILILAFYMWDQYFIYTNVQNILHIVSYLAVMILEIFLIYISLKYFIYVIEKKEKVEKRSRAFIFGGAAFVGISCFSYDYVSEVHAEAYSQSIIGGFYMAEIITVVIMAGILFYFLYHYRHSLSRVNSWIFFINLTVPLCLIPVRFWPYMPMVLCFNISIVFMYFSIYQNQMKDSILADKLMAEQKDALAKVKMSTMLSSIQPDFLKDCLALIEKYCDIDAAKANKLTIDLSTYLRGNLDASKEDMLVHFEKELEHTKLYIEMEKEILDHPFQVEYDISAMDFFIPAASLQPLVQNALQNGILRKERGGVIRILSRDYKEAWVIQIIDNGPGFDMKSVSIDDILGNEYKLAKERLEKKLGAQLAIDTQLGRGCCLTIAIPKGGEVNA